MVVENNLVKMLYCHNTENHFLKIDVVGSKSFLLNVLWHLYTNLVFGGGEQNSPN